LQWEIRAFLRKGKKYAGLFRIHLKNHFAYIQDFLIRTLFLIVVLFIFTQLWGVTYEVTGKDRIAGFSLPMMMWYLTVTESIMMAYPPLVERVEQEVKSGQVAVTLIRPFSYVAAHFSAYLAEFILRLFINLAIGGALVFLLFGPPEMGPGQLGRFLLFLPVSLLIHFSFTMCIALFAFWFEEVQGFHHLHPPADDPGRDDASPGDFSGIGGAVGPRSSLSGGNLPARQDDGDGTGRLVVEPVAEADRMGALLPRVDGGHLPAGGAES
jgi:ABC-type uncharacterized transport system permease subunit